MAINDTHGRLTINNREQCKTQHEFSPLVKEEKKLSIESNGGETNNKQTNTKKR